MMLLHRITAASVPVVFAADLVPVDEDVLPVVGVSMIQPVAVAVVVRALPVEAAEVERSESRSNSSAGQSDHDKEGPPDDDGDPRSRSRLSCSPSLSNPRLTIGLLADHNNNGIVGYDFLNIGK